MNNYATREQRIQKQYPPDIFSEKEIANVDKYERQATVIILSPGGLPYICNRNWVGGWKIRPFGFRADGTVYHHDWGWHKSLPICIDVILANEDHLTDVKRWYGHPTPLQQHEAVCGAPLHDTIRPRLAITYEGTPVIDTQAGQARLDELAAAAEAFWSAW